MGINKQNQDAYLQASISVMAVSAPHTGTACECSSESWRMRARLDGIMHLLSCHPCSFLVATGSSCFYLLMTFQMHHFQSVDTVVTFSHSLFHCLQTGIPSYTQSLGEALSTADQQVSQGRGPLSCTAQASSRGREELLQCVPMVVCACKIYYKRDIFSHGYLRLFSFSVPASAPCSSCWSGVPTK